MLEPLFVTSCKRLRRREVQLVKCLEAFAAVLVEGVPCWK